MLFASYGHLKLSLPNQPKSLEFLAQFRFFSRKFSFAGNPRQDTCVKPVLCSLSTNSSYSVVFAFNQLTKYILLGGEVKKRTVGNNDCYFYEQCSSFHWQGSYQVCLHYSDPQIKVHMITNQKNFHNHAATFYNLYAFSGITN